MQWFGKNWGAAVCRDCPNVPTPVGESCAYCMEPIGKDDNGVIILMHREKTVSQEPWHYECHVRSITGSVGHQNHECSCHGKRDISEIGLTLREASLRAVALFEELDSLRRKHEKRHFN